MRFFSTARRRGFCLLLGLLSLSARLEARNPEHLDEQFRTLSGYLEQGDLERGGVLLDLILKEFGPDALREIGPRFGRFFYLRGLFDMAAGEYETAAVRFEACHRLYANQGPLAATRPNTFVDEALVRHISCLMALERFDETADLFPRVDRSGLDTMGDQWTLSVNQGLAMMHTGREEEGVAYLRRILDNRDNPNITPSMRMEVVRLLALHWADEAPFDEVRRFAHGIRDVVRNATSEDRRLSNPFFYDAARQAFERGEMARCLLWMGFFDTAEAVAAAESPRNDTPASPTEQLLDGALALTAAAHLELGNPFGALPAFDALLSRFPGHAQAAEHRKNRTLTRIAAGQYAQALADATAFRSAFPDSPHAPEVESLLLELLLSRGEAEAARNLADDILSRKTVDAATASAAYVRGILLYQESRFPEAAEALQAYAERFADGAHHAAALYYLAASRYQQNRLDEAAEVLGRMVEAHPGSDLLPAALLLRAQILSRNGRAPEARASLRRLLADAPDAPEAPAASLLMAELLAETTETDPAEVRTAFEQAHAAAVRAGDGSAAGEALQQLALLSVRAGDVEEMERRIDAYLETGTPAPADALEVLEAAWGPMGAAGKRDKLVAHLERLLLRHGVRRDAPALYLLVETARELLQREPADVGPLQTLAAAPDTPVPLRAALELAYIDTLDDGQEDLRARLYRNLAEEIPREEMSTYVLTRLGRHLEETGDAGGAAGIQDYLRQHREGETGYEFVLLDIALAKADSERPEVRADALRDFQQVLTHLEDPEAREKAHVGIARVHSRNGDWARAEAAWGEVLARRDWVWARAEANFGFARAIEGTGDTRRALGYYVSVYSNFAGQLDWSTQAYLRAADLMHAQGKPKEALLILQDMLRRLHTADHPNIDRAKTQFNQWRDEFVRSQQP